jgi:hypothetical protein
VKRPTAGSVGLFGRAGRQLLRSASWCRLLRCRARPGALLSPSALAASGCRREPAPNRRPRTRRRTHSESRGDQ